MFTYVITGRPGSGKSTLFNNIVELLKSRGYRVGGIKTPEIRGDRGYRIGFKVVDLLSGEEAWLAKRNYFSNVRVGKYGVLVDEAERLIVKALSNALERADIIGVDEVGPMELKIPSFKYWLLKILETTKPRILVIHYRLSDQAILSRISDAKRYVVTVENREELNKMLPYKVLEDIEKTRR